MNGTGRAGLAGGAVAVVLLAFGPLLGHLLRIDTSFISEVLLTAIAAMGVNLLMGYTGLPIFGLAAFFGLGAYGAALWVKDANGGFFDAIAVGTLAGLVGALLVAPFLLRRRNIYFGLLSIAFGQVFYFIAYRYSDLTGGEDGMAFPRPPIKAGPLHAAVNETTMYYVTYALFVFATVAFSFIVRSPFGRTLIAIRQNELRVRYLGLNTDRFIFVAIIVAATYAGLAGALYGLLLRFAFPLLMDWHQSGDFVLMTLLGGAGTVLGPLVGAIIFVIGKDIISTITPAWQIVLGGFFIACVLGFPKGILGSIGAALAARRSPGEMPPEVAPAEPVRPVPTESGT